MGEGEISWKVGWNEMNSFSDNEFFFL